MSEKIWLKYYPPGVPAEINPRAFGSLVDLLERSCQQFAARPAVSNMGNSLTFAELERLSRQFAAYLQQSLSLNKGDRVAIMLPNILQYYVAMFGILRAGMVVVNINPLYTARELEEELADAKAETIIVMANFAHILQKALPKTEVKHIIVTEIGDLLGVIRGGFVNFVVRHVKKWVPPFHFSYTSFKSALQTGAQQKFVPAAISLEDTAYLQYTGGTTGIPKGAVLTHANMVANVEQALAWIKGGDVLQFGKEQIIAPLPLYHIMSLTVCALCFLQLGGTVHLITNPRDLTGMIKIMKKIPFSAMVGVNTLFNGLLNHPDFNQLDFSQVKVVVAGGSAVQPSVAQRWQQVTGVPILEGYGLTEASPVVTVNPINLQAFNGSIGLPLPSTDVEVRDNDGQNLPPGGIGELCVKGPQVMSCYWRNEEETKRVFTADGWLKTGDIGRYDEHGYFYIVDRKKDMILVSGFNVYPNEIEAVISRHPGVLEVAVVGVPSATTGEAVAAFVVKKDPQLTEQQLLEYCHNELTGYKIPKHIEFVASLPKSAVGKVLRYELKNR